VLGRNLLEAPEADFVLEYLGVGEPERLGAVGLGRLFDLALVPDAKMAELLEQSRWLANQ